ncbi:MAG: aldo/keto reductase [Halobacteriales archaeon]
MVENGSDTFELGSDLTVHRLGFGAMSLAGSNNTDWPDDPDGARRVAERAVELGVDFIDTADMYGNGSSELIVGEALDVDRDDLVVATKGGILKFHDGKVYRGDPPHLKTAAMRSKVRLRTDRIDLYQYHRPANGTPFEASVEALADLKDGDVVEHVGLSNVSVEQLDRAREITEIATVQNRYNVADRRHEDVLEYCESRGIGFMPYSPTKGLAERGEDLDAVAANHDATRRQIALAWLLERSPVILPIPGTSSLEHLAENVAASAIDLAGDEMARLE